ncbi:MAG: hypothetical protein EBT26_06445 [Microbacteriaceae bacterium]|nr:hypothetical protein [Microbacteriaceae bacterium]
MFKVKIDNDPKKPKFDVAPKLRSVLLSVYNKYPSLMFEISRGDCVYTSMIDNSEFYTKVCVYQGFQCVGYIRYTYTDHRGGKNWVYVVGSGNINKKRGSRHAIKTVNPLVATKKILEYFKPEPLDALSNNLYESAKNNLDALLYEAERNIRYSAKDGVGIACINYVVSLRTGNSTDLPDFEISPSLPEHCNTYDITINVFRHVIGFNAVAVFEMKDGVFVVVDKLSDTPNKVYQTVSYQSKENIPSPISEKLMMLSFVEPKQPIRDVGVRWQDDKSSVYFVVKGDIITDS